MTDDLLVHGMGRELVAPDWPALTLPEVADLLRPYGLSARRLAWLSPRPLSAAAVVQTDRRAVFVKRHSSVVRTVNGLAEEHAFADHLRERGIPVPAVLTDQHGLRAIAIGPWTYEVHEQGRGADTYRDVPSWEPFLSCADSFATGAMLARIALAAAGFDAPTRRPQLLVASAGAILAPDLLPALEQHVRARPLLQAALRGRDWRADVERLLVPLHARLVPHLEGLATGWTHGDGHASNFMWRGSQVSDVLDLGLSDRTTPLFDLASAIERHCIGWLDPMPMVRFDFLAALLAGWSSVRPINARDAAALAALVPLVHVEFALSELAYFDRVTGSAQHAQLAYDGYLLGHARWFASEPGTELCQLLGESAVAGLPELHRALEDAGDVVLGDLAGTGRQQPLLLHRAVDQPADVAVTEADGGDAVGNVDVTHERGKHRR